MIAAQITTLSLSGIGLAFLAGLLSFISPCVLPLLPVYLSFISGVGVESLGGEHRRLLWTSLLFVAGFTVVFVAMGAGAHRHEHHGETRDEQQRSPEQTPVLAAEAFHPDAGDEREIHRQQGEHAGRDEREQAREKRQADARQAERG